MRRVPEKETLTAALALASTPPQADIALYPIARDVPSIGQVKPALWIVLVSDQESELRAIDSLGLLRPRAIIAVVPASSLSIEPAPGGAAHTIIPLDWESATEETIDNEGMLSVWRTAHAMLYPQETSR
jgi:hypothetical protein